MEITTIAVFLPLGFVFLCTGLIVNFIQAACLLIIRPLSKNLFRRINGAVTEILWLMIIWLMEWWAGLKIELYTDMSTYQALGKEFALVMPNHLSDVDVLIMMLLAQRFGCLRSALMVVKKSYKYLPLYGWSCWFHEFVFLERSWEKDEQILKSIFQGLKDFPTPFWLTLFVEGTRMTSDKLLAAQEFATSRGLHVPRNVLVPRTKGFVTAVKHLRSFVPVVYDVTIAVPKGHAIPTLLRLLKGQPSVVKMHIKRYSMKELPESDVDIAQWCKDRFVAKDAVLDKFQTEGTFGDQKIQDAPRSLKTLLVSSTCASLCSLGMFKFCQLFSLLSSWKGNAILAGCLTMVVLLFHIFIEFTRLPKMALRKLN
ncbi:1-acyl-sn-glycerol-3-phosphate acyltransferase PLS1-like [Fagus crenata]